MGNELFWAYVGFSDVNAGKTRPVLCMRTTATHYVVFRLSSQYENKSDYIKGKYVEVKDWKQSGLSKPSWIDTVRAYELAIADTQMTYIGALSNDDMQRLIDHLSPKK